MSRLVVIFILACSVALIHGFVWALECPPMPEQINKDWEVQVNATIAKIGPVKGAELVTKTKNATKDLLGKLPHAGKIYLEQMMYSSYCSALRDDKSLKESEKANLLREYNREVRKALSNTSSKGSESKFIKSKKTKQENNLNTIKPKTEELKKANQEAIEDKVKKSLNLKDLFTRDFQTILKTNADHVLGMGVKSENNQEILVTIKKQLYQDFASQTTFVGFYIPATIYTYFICAFLADNYNIALDLLKMQKIEFSMPGLQPVNSNELNFSNRVFIYNEYPLFEDQKRELFSLYKSKGLSVQFRDWKYVAEKNGLLTTR